MTSPEPIAVIGMACRFAGGVDSPEKFWDLLREGRDTIGDLPPGRWDWYATQGRDFTTAVAQVTKRGAFLEDVTGFDAEFFGITPREAALMDPQQRMILELSWEALEDAGVPADRLAGTDAGVFMGVGADDYGRRLLEDLPRIEAWTGIGGAYCAVANRVSYVLDLRGPSMSVDTACSSSLVSIHLAAQSLRAGECPVALAGGVLVMAAPGLSMVLDAAGATAPDGRSKSFDAAADGYGRGEGGGVLVLKRLTDARRDGDRVLAVIRGSAVHQDGRTNGIMAPSGPAQAHLLRRAYDSAGIDPASVDYVEAHGTGTRVGDPLEAGALAAVFGPDRPADRPLLIGSAKTNVGHLEAGAGATGVIKAILALRHGEIPPSLHFDTPNPEIDWDAGLRVVTEHTSWPVGSGPRRAGVSGYGYGGTIAHVILEAAESETPTVSDAAADLDPTAQRPDHLDPTAQRPGDLDPTAQRPDHLDPTAQRPDGPALFPISGASPAAVRAYADRLADRLARPERPTLADVGHTLAHRRTHLAYRAAVVAADHAQLVSRLRALAAPDAAPPPARTLPHAGRGVVWVFSGHGSQWIGMGRELSAHDPAFADVIDALEPVFRTELGVSPGEVLRQDTAQPVDVIQPMIFAVQVALAASLRARGMRPAAVIGHSVGEIAAAVTAGALTMEQGARLVCRRSVLLRRVAGQGAMAMVDLSADETARLIGDRPDVSVAIVAAPTSTVISGAAAAVEQVAESLRATGHEVRRIDSDVAFHSPQMDPLLEPLAAAAHDLPPAAPAIPLYTTALADPRSPAARDGGYWAANLRQPVRLAQAVTAALDDGHRLFLEVAPHPVVSHSITDTIDQLAITDAHVAHTLRRHRPERETLLTAVGRLFCHGAPIDWTAVWPDGGLTGLPTTVWQHRPHWYEEPVGRSFLTEQHDPQSHTLLGGRINVHGTTVAQAWLTYLDRDSRPYPGDHPVRSVEIVPAAVLLNTFRSAAASDSGAPDLTDVALRVPVSVTNPRYLQTVLQDGTIRLSSRIADDQANDDLGWLTHTTATIEPPSNPQIEPPWAVNVDEELPDGYVIDRLATLGVAAMGFAWTIDQISRGAGTLLATARTAAPPPGAPASWAPMLDAALSTASVVFAGAPILRMPAGIDRVSLSARPPDQARIAVRVSGEDTVEVQIVDVNGEVRGRLRGLRYGTLDSDSDGVADPRRLVHHIRWRPWTAPDPTPPRAVLLVGPESPLADRITSELRHRGLPYRQVADADDLRDVTVAGGHRVVVVPPATGAPAETAVAAGLLLVRVAQWLGATARDGTDPVDRPRLWCVTEGVREGRAGSALGHSPLWGLSRIIRGEHPDLWGALLDIGDAPSDLATVVDIVGAGGGGEDVLVIRDGEPTVPRLHRLTGPATRPTLACEPDGTYLVTGGLGALGLEIAQWLTGRGARRIVLAGRRTLPPRDTWDDLSDPHDRARVRTIRALERLGVTVATVQVDVADADAVAKLLSPAALGLPPIRGVVHAAGVLDNRTVADLDEESLRTVLRPKVDGAMALHEAFPPGSVDFFVLFSSCGGLLGLPGQAAYAAGNAFLDTLAAHRRARGDQTAVSFGWTSWRGLGMSTSSEIIDLELAARGTGDITVAEAFGAWELATRHGLAYAAVLRTLPPAPGALRLPLLSELPRDAQAESAPPTPAVSPWAGLSGPGLRTAVAAEVRREVAAVAGLPADEVDPLRPLSEMGLDSVMTVRIRRGLERRFDLPLPATLFWDRPTIDAVAALLAGELPDAATAPTAEPTSPTTGRPEEAGA
ncbi:type I polyketide synthase [Solwaraspora sp. WMMD406]|uniref:type I polyketide synthase n=1 Tax=Solwaraspora sp. WMMD406 TaxID=3016095 RepID=UPI002417AF3F|nr:type I polyketide synthase [Solwaraspora sp. WMMD406]MDG4766926.1 type I polyketide synthase [Solwaraspora sp. WMMD406]